MALCVGIVLYFSSPGSKDGLSSIYLPNSFRTVLSSSDDMDDFWSSASVYLIIFVSIIIVVEYL